MKCPFCRSNEDRVVDTRASDDGFMIRRRRACNACGKKFTTYERIEVTNVRVIKRDGTRVPFDRAKLREGIERACWKRPISEGQISALVAELETRIESDGDTEVDTERIGELVMSLLKNLDDVAYVRFASVYRRFKNVEDFAKELEPMLTHQTTNRSGT
ncbi:MAG: transcriptional regulator NrdR [Planctomycetia bacterium]|nr:transcriptional regulator NrdR [Planctomycetia bacterium]